ncbi:MAG: type 1 glutamine amidotransferase-like domain-containing protein, partial [Gammaproteobacteria bacterium]|nr:type 1 glutamine amidotransferase-like domain-containing protein [Gammaproteobacteria bacterium]
AQVRALDRHHLRQVEKAHTRCDDAISPASWARLSDYRDAVAEELQHYETVLITGGNVVVLMNRLRLFGLDKQLRHKNIVAWSAGAMVLCEHIVLFHDRLPQGRRDSEIMCAGMDILPHTVVLPDPQRRLRAKDATRTSLFSRRFAPATCVTLDNGASLLFRGDSLLSSTAAKRMTRTGKFVRVRAA